MTHQICKVVENINGQLDFISPAVTSKAIEDVIEEDKKYGTFRPANGEYYTWRIINGDEEFSKRKAKKSIWKTIRRFEIRLKLKFKMAKVGEIADFRIEFRTTAEDNVLTSNTLMYHYYPISDINNPYRGLCVVNKDFNWTTHGNSISLNDPNFPNNTSSRTYDFDAIYTHELGHGFGLPHSALRDQVMSPNASIMSEWLTEEEDLPRLYAKYEKREMSEHKLTRWLNWLFHASER